MNADAIMREDEEFIQNQEEDSQKLTDLPGVGAATAEKLESAGYSDFLSIAVGSVGEIVEATGVTEATARKVIKFARDSLKMGFITGEEVLQKRALVQKISTGSKAFDDLMDGGFETGAITECFGEFGSGKCIEKNTPVLYFNPDKAHLQSIEHVYEKYKEKNGEKAFDDGHIVEIPTVDVLGLTKNGLQRTSAEYLYKEYVETLYEIKTKRGRKIKVTGPHKLLSFENGMQWKPAAMLTTGDLIAYPKDLNYAGETGITEDDSYFLGLFAAEGCSNPLSITTGSAILKDWLCKYVETNHDYAPTVKEKKGKTDKIYLILLRNASKSILDSLVGTNSASKHVPESVLSGDVKITQQFLAGYMDGDGHFAENYAEATTKSEELATGLSYLFLKLGMPSTLKKKINEMGTYFRLSIVGEERVNLNGLPGKIKSANYEVKNSAYGYSKAIVKYLQQVYKQTLGGNRGCQQKEIGRKNNEGETFYHYLTRSDYVEKSMNAVTFQRIREIFFEGLKKLQGLVATSEKLSTLSVDEQKSLFSDLPFAFNSLDVGLTKQALQNYQQRGLPDDKVELIQTALLNELSGRRDVLEPALKTMKNVAYLNFDEIETIKEVSYKDFVYDFVVPDGHSFVGGAVPTIMHNTQIGHILAVNCLKEDPTSTVVYIDTENTFRPERIKQLADGIEIDGDEALKRIMVAKAFNSDHQMLLAEKVEELIKKQGKKVKLVIVDSLMAHFRSEFVGRGTLSERQQKLNKHLHVLLKTASNYNLCVYVTNQVMSDPGAFFGDPTKAVGGNIVAHASTFRIYLRKGKKGSRVAKLIDAPNLPDGECNFFVEVDGLKDV